MKLRIRENEKQDVRQEFTSEYDASKYQRKLIAQGITAWIYPHYNSKTQQATFVVDYYRGLGEKNMIIKETWLDDEEYLDAGDIVYEAKAYYDKSHRSLAKSEEFPNAYELDEWIWDMCQQGYYVEVYDYEDEEYYYYRWPDNAEYMELYEPQDLETDRQGNFLYIKDEGLK